MATVHSMELPRRVVVGSGILGMVGEVCSGMDIPRRVLVVSDVTTYTLAADTVLNSLTSHSFDVESLQIDGSFQKALKTVQLKIAAAKPRIVLGLGGGTVIDITKYASFKAQIPFISAPTAASHDGIVSPHVSLKDRGNPVSVKAQAPLAIIADIEVIAKAPYRLTASGCGDIIAKYTAVRDWWLSHNLRNEYYGDYAANLAMMSAKLVARSAGIIHERSAQGISTVVEALISCGVAMSIAGSSRPCSGSEHLFSHALEKIAPERSLHGERCGVGTIMMAYLHKLDWRKIRRVLEMIGAPTNVEELNATPEQLVEALITAHKIRPDRYTILGEKGLSREAALKLAKNTGVI